MGVGTQGGRLQLILMRRPPPAICQNLWGGGGSWGGGSSRGSGGCRIQGLGPAAPPCGDPPWGRSMVRVMRSAGVWHFRGMIEVRRTIDH